MTSIDQEKTLALEAPVLPQITSEIPSHPVPFDPKWKHLKQLDLADPEFGKPGTTEYWELTYLAVWYFTANGLVLWAHLQL